MRNPSVYKARTINKWDSMASTTTGKWIPARPLGWQGLYLFKNIKIAWFVFTGKYDALDWED